MGILNGPREIMGKSNSRETFKVGGVTLVCICGVGLMTARVFHDQIDLAVMGPVLLFLGYLVSEAWAPVAKWSPTVFWCATIVLTSIVEIVFAYFA